MTNLKNNTIITFISRILLILISGITAILLARFLGPYKMGIYSLIILIPTLAFKLGSFGIEASNIYYLGSKRYTKTELALNSFITATLISIVLILIFLSGTQLPLFQNFVKSKSVPLQYLWIVVTTIPFFILFQFLNGILIGDNCLKQYNAINIVYKIIEMTLLILFIVILKFSLFGALLSFGSAIVLISTYLWFSITRNLSINIFSFNLKILKNSFTYGSMIYLSNLIQFINYRIDLFLLAYFCEPTIVGIYTISISIAEQLWLLPNSIAIVLFPKISSENGVYTNELTNKLVRHTLFITFIASLLVGFCSHKFILLFFGPSFVNATQPLLILLPGVIAISITKLLSANLAGRGKPHFSLLATFISVLINIPLNILFIPKWYAAGAALASTISYIVTLFVITIAYVNISRSNIINLFLIKPNELKEYVNILKVFRLFK